MGLVRNLAVMLVATTVLVAGLVVLFPQSGSAAFVHLTGGSVDTPRNTADAPFKVRFEVEIPPGEHIPADFVKVVVADNLNDARDAEGDLIGPFLCEAQSSTAAPTTPRVNILSVRGAARVHAAFHGYGYEVAASGSTLVFEDPAHVFNAGTGYGYGKGNPNGATLTVEVDVIGCVFTYNADHRANVIVQAYVGSAAAQLRSFPARVAIFDPTFTASNPVTTPGGVDTTEQRTTSSGGRTTTDVIINVPGAPATCPPAVPPCPGYDSVGAGVAVTVDMPAGSGASKMVLRTKIPLPEGARISFTAVSSDTGGTPSLTNPPFGIDPTALGTQLKVTPAAFFQIKLNIPGLGEVDPATYFSTVDMDIPVPQSYFDGVSRSPASFAVKGFTDAGAVKSTHPSVPSKSLAGSVHTYNVRISAFSSFAGGATGTGGGIGGGGGGGGGGGVVIPPGTTPTTTPTVQPTVTVPVPTVPVPTDTGTIPLPTTATSTSGPAGTTAAPGGGGGTSTGTMIGIVVGILVLLAIIGVVVMTLRNRGM